MQHVRFCFFSRFSRRYGRQCRVACSHVPATFSASSSYVGVCVARRAHCEVRTVSQSTRYRGNMIHRHIRDVWLTTTPRGVVYGAFRRLRGAPKATFRDPLFIFRFINRHFIFCVRLSLTWHAVDYKEVRSRVDPRYIGLRRQHYSSIRTISQAG